MKFGSQHDNFYRKTQLKIVISEIKYYKIKKIRIRNYEDILF